MPSRSNLTAALLLTPGQCLWCHQQIKCMNQIHACQHCSSTHSRHLCSCTNSTRSFPLRSTERIICDCTWTRTHRFSVFEHSGFRTPWPSHFSFLVQVSCLRNLFCVIQEAIIFNFHCSLWIDAFWHQLFHELLVQVRQLLKSSYSLRSLDIRSILITQAPSALKSSKTSLPEGVAKRTPT